MLKNIWFAYSLLKHREFQTHFEKSVAGATVGQSLRFTFRDENFKHIAGFHKLKLNNMKDAKRIPEMIRTEKISLHSVTSSQKSELYYSQRGVLLPFMSMWNQIGPNWMQIFYYI